jgi:hypothetical protein
VLPAMNVNDGRRADSSVSGEEPTSPKCAKRGCESSTGKV